jgi:tetratricopeptide (TPR) repeat protein
MAVDHTLDSHAETRARAQALAAQEAYAEAFDLLLPLFDGGDRSFALLIELTLCSLMLGQDTDARRFLSMSARRDEQHTRVHAYQGFMCLLEEDYIKARQHLDRSLARDANNAEAYKWRGLCFRELGEPERALADLDRAATMRPQDASLLVNRGTVYSDLGDLSRALRDFERAATIAPDQPQAHANAGHILVELNRLDDARERYDRAIELDYQSTDAWLGLAELCVRRCDWGEALRSLCAVLALEPHHAEAHFRMGRVLLTLDDAPRALKHLKAATRSAPDAEALTLRAIARFQLGAFGRCLADCEQALRIAPDMAMAYLYRGLAKLELGVSPTQGPADDIWRAQSLDPTDPSSALALAELTLQQGHDEEAHAWLTRALSLDPAVAARLERSPTLTALLSQFHLTTAPQPPASTPRATTSDAHPTRR